MRVTWAIAAVLVAGCNATIGGGPGGPGGDDAAVSGDGAPGGDGAVPVDSAVAVPDAPGGVGEPPELAGITLAHNQERMKVGVPPLAWDPQLQAIAAAWVAQCIDADGNGLVDHNAGRSDNYSTYVGENIYASSGTATGQGAVSLWVSEAQYYDYASNTCAAGHICGHYTQVVWSTTQKLGCALGNCPGLTYPSTIVCDYGPGGNNGGRPY